MSTATWVKYLLVLVLATLFTFFFHEMSHWLAYKLMGYDAGFTLNRAFLVDSELSLSATERIITSAAGPIFTIIQAIVCYVIIIKRKQILLYPFLFLPFIMRLGAAWANQFEPNDEGRISLEFGLNLYVISGVVVAFLLALVYKASRKNGYSLIFNVITFIVAAILLLGLTYLDSKLDIRII